ncbi:MAG: hypothetical protein JXR80_00150 [Deltaproteobacteria bacterium]|nr:hypothetical protein [Deltaproteobacteria bacterium]
MSEKQKFTAENRSSRNGRAWRPRFGLLLVFGLIFFTGQAQASGHESPVSDTLATVKVDATAPVMVSADGLLPIPLEVAKPRTNEECMKCHKEPHLTSSRLDGSPAKLQIELERFKESLHGKKLECIDCHEDAAAARHCRSGFQKVNCLACHSKIEGLFPLGAHKRLQEKKIRIPQRKMVGDSYYQSKHGKALLAGKENAPKCYSCHTRHYVYGAKEENSTVNRANLTATCSACHKERQVTTLLEHLTTFRLEAHRKGDMSFDYDRGNCIDCHQGDAVHGLKVNEAPCARCHDSKVKVKSVALAGLGPFHLYPNYEKQYSIWCLRNFYGVLVLLLLVGAGCWLLLYILRRSADYYRKEGGE